MAAIRKEVLLQMELQSWLPFEKLRGLTTDGAPVVVGSHKGLVALVKKELEPLSLDPYDLMVCHYILHQENLRAQSLRLNHAMSTVVSC